MEWLRTLNDEQCTAVTAPDGPLMIIAGPGTGKTKTLTARIAHLIAESRAPVGAIAALTFTNKAAREMTERVAALLGGNRERPLTTTFHALCLRILTDQREQAPTFISDTDRLAVLKEVRKQCSLSGRTVRDIGLMISRAKSSLAPTESEQAAVAVYNQALAERDVCDFDDLLLDTLALLEHDHTLRTRLQNTYTHLLVDEFQDTNPVQYAILKLLAGHGNIMVIGDPAQSIYGFRGASGGVFEQFTHDFPKVRKVTLHVNYRSTATIVQVANAIFPDREPLAAHQSVSGQVQVVEVLNEYSEARWILATIQRQIGGADFQQAISDDIRSEHSSLRDFAVLYRNRAVARQLTAVLEASGLPYQVVGEGSPYETPEMQQVIAVLQSVTDPSLSVDTQTQHIRGQLDTTQSPAAIARQILNTLSIERAPFAQLLHLLERFDMLPAALQYLDEIREQGFYDPNADAITLLTIHASKGLEFAHVFCLGCEASILPHKLADEAEEKRLFYVAVTRAKERLDLLHARRRGSEAVVLSPFVAELPATLAPRIIDDNLARDQARIKKQRLKRAQGSLF